MGMYIRRPGDARAGGGGGRKKKKKKDPHLGAMADFIQSRITHDGQMPIFSAKKKKFSLFTIF